MLRRAPFGVSGCDTETEGLDPTSGRVRPRAAPRVAVRDIKGHVDMSSLKVTDAKLAPFRSLPTTGPAKGTTRSARLHNQSSGEPKGWAPTAQAVR